MYLTPEDYDIAERNGISKRNVEQRFYRYGWSKERATTQSIIRKRRYEKEYQQALENGLGITYKGLFKRLENGWSTKDAITIPCGYTRNSYLDKPYIKKAKDNGISTSTYRSRRNRGWSRKRACSEPLQKERKHE